MNGRAKIIKHLKGNIVLKNHELRLGSGFLNMTAKAQAIQEEN